MLAPDDPFLLDFRVLDDRSLVGLETDTSLALRVFEVLEVEDGVGYRVMELAEGDPRSLWIVDPDGSWVAEPGATFAARFADDAAIRMPPHVGCPLCEAERARRQAAAALRAVGSVES